MASNIPAPTQTAGSSTNSRLGSHSITAGRLPARKPLLPVPGSTTPKSNVLTKRKPIASRDIAQQPTAPRQSPLKREPPPPRPAKGGGRGFVGTTLQTQLRRENLDSVGFQPPSRVAVFEPARTPSLVSGSSASTADSPRSNILRRRGSFGGNGQRASPDSTSSQEDRKTRDPLVSPYEDLYPDAVFGISLPPSQSILASKGPDDVIIDLDRFMRQPPLITHDLPPPTSQYPLSVASSTRSPGLFSISSTPTSATSYSPANTNTSAKPSLSIPRQTSPVKRPSNARKSTGESTGGKENTSSTPARQSSSSSGSTVRAGEPEIRRLRSPSASVGRDSPSRNRLTRTKTRLESPEKEKSSSASRTASRSAAGRRPPELAHLSDALPLQRTISQRPPVRPSRRGTPDMNLKEPLPPVIQSNMSSLPPSLHKRQGSSDSRKGSADTLQPVEVKSRFGIPRKSPSRNPSPSPSTPAVNKPAARGTTPEIVSDSERPSKSQPSPNPERSQSRFGFFKRGKSEPQPPAPIKDKRLRKGPAAGTGHEGYGKFGLRGRSGSTTSGNTSVDRSSSADSGHGNVTQPSSRKNSVGSKTGSDVDEFLAERLIPITLRGSGSPPHTERKDSGNGDEHGGSSQTSEPLSKRTAQSRPVDEEETPRTLLPSPIVNSQAETSTRGAPKSGGISTNEQKASRFAIPNLSAKRASRRSLLDGRSIVATQEDIFSDFRFPTHPAIYPLERKLSEPSENTMSYVTQAPVIGQRAETQPKVTPKLARKWNFLWGHKTTKKDEKVAPDVLSVQVPSHPPPRSVAHYAMMDAPGNIDLVELEKIMQEAETTAEKSPLSDSTPDVREAIRRHGNSVLLPEPPAFVPDFALPARPASPKVALQIPQSALEQSVGHEQHMTVPASTNGELQPEIPNARPSRLPQVGRIPRVVSKRDRERKPSISSFSRPFGSAQPSPAMQSPQFPEDTNYSIPSRFAGDEFITLKGDMPAPILPTTITYTESPESLNGPMATPFLSFSPRNNSEQSTISSSSGRLGLTVPLLGPTPRATSGYDEVWSEYDDLLDLLSYQTPKTPKTPHTGSSFGAPFQYAELASPLDDSAAPGHGSPQQIPIPSVPAILRRIRFPSARESQVLYSSAVVTTPTSPVSVSDFLAQSGDRSTSALGSLSGRMSLPSTARWSSGTSRISLPPPVAEAPCDGALQVSTTLTVPNSSNNRRDSVNVQLMEAQHMGFETMANLRFSALMTSKWLSFGRVLFSPAHFELRNAKEDRVLVLDGLGKDWSFYVALNYSNAMIYNLGPDPVESNASRNASIGSQSNHRHIHHPSLLSHFPFPKGFFAAVVFRFPGITSEAAYRFTLGECKRVLRPGGHLEVSVLDMDMLNMGNLGRRALRSLKEKINAEDSSVSLKPISDTIQRLLGRRGFENLNRCFVGVPAAGGIPNSREGSSDQTSLSGSPVKTSFNMQNTSDIGELLRDQSGSGDDDVTRMVGRVARWWYSRCYESHVLSSGEMSRSIWSDEALLDECEKRGTSLRLMVCFAQKPECAVRRTISV